MKRISYIIIVTISLIMVSCQKSFIDLQPISSVGVDNLYKTDNDFSNALTGCYSVLRNQYQNFYIFGDVRGDDSWQEIVKNNSQSYSDGFVTNSSDGLMESTWRNYYNLIFLANTILSKIDKADVSAVPNKDRYIGEALFLRALSYFDLVRIFGDIPLLTEPATIETSYKVGRKSVDSIYNELIIPGFQNAIGKLPPKYSGADVGRPTSGAATAMLGRVYLTIKDFKDAEVTLQKVTTMGYSLVSNYNDLFDYAKDEHTSEYIFDIEYEATEGEGSKYTNAFMPNYAPMQAYYNVIGPGDEQNSPTQDLINLFSPEDKRRDITIGVRGGFYNSDSDFIALPPATSQTYTKKYITGEPDQNESSANWKIIRYADVLLMYAEALNENGKTADALTNLNLVRQRAGLKGYTNLSQAETRTKIYIERRLELSFEGVRWFDLVRTDSAFSVMEKYGMRPYMTVFPIPLSQVQLMNDPSIFPQNQGYD